MLDTKKNANYKPPNIENFPKNAAKSKKIKKKSWLNHFISPFNHHLLRHHAFFGRGNEKVDAIRTAF